MDKRNPSQTQATERTPIDRKTSELSAFRLVVVDGPDKGAMLQIPPDSPCAVLVGTGPACNLVLSDRQISRRHVSLEPKVAALRLLDLGSTNGTRVNGIGVTDGSLRGGELVKIGETTLQVELLAEASAMPLWPVESFGRLLGTSVAMRRLYPLFQKLAASNLPLIIEGETGTGKELLSESLHEMGPRKNHPFIVFDCTTSIADDVEAALYGEEDPRGHRAIRRGVFEEADKGTLLLDEVGELSLTTQARLLRTLERGIITRVGGDKPIQTDVRILATTRRNLDREVEHGRFREDLFFRLAGARVALPPLRDRTGDVGFIAMHMWKQVANGQPLPDDVLASFEGYGWPGNVRELGNVIARKASLGDLYPSEAQTKAVDLSNDEKVFERVFALNLPLPAARARVVAEFERYFVERILAKHGGNVSHAAAASGIARRYFQVLKTRSR
jgi:DNA-binding NtrC family response regulator